MLDSPSDIGPRTALAVRGLSKTFVGQRALDAVDLQVWAGEIHALLGENGSGKSTLIKCLAGFHAPDDGAQVELDGVDIPLPLKPRAAADAGLLFVHQDLGLIPNLSVAENFAIGQRYGTGPLSPIRWKAIRRHAREALARLGRTDVDVNVPVGRLPLSTQTIVAIVRTLATAEDGARVLVLDEPTAALPDAESELVLAAVRQVAERGISVLYVSHKLEEIVRIADRATILRDGKLVATVSCAGIRENDLIRLIVGHDVEFEARPPQTADARVVLEVVGLRSNRVSDVSFAINAGEIVGLAGMLGSGRSEIARILFGAQQPHAGQILLDGRLERLSSPIKAVERGIAYVPENRRRDGGVLELSVATNLTLPTIRSFFTWGWMRGTLERREVARLMSVFAVSPPDPRRLFKFLSGGNQQKVVIAKWLSRPRKFVVFDEPVQGVDAGARAEIVELIRDAASSGTAVLVISSELDVLLGACDRVLVLRGGQIIADRESTSMSRHDLSELVYFGTNSTEREAAPEGSSHAKEPSA